MIELLNIIYIIFFSLVILSFDFSESLIIKLNLKKLSIIEKFSINIILFCLVFLIISFIEMNYKILNYFLFLISLISLLINYKNNFLLQSNNRINLVIFFIIIFVLSCDIIANPKLEWDGHSWYFHALNFYENFKFFNLEGTSFQHYPHLGGFIWSFFWNISLLDQESFGRIGYIVIYAISILCVSENVSKNLYIKLLFTLVLIFSTYDKFLFGGYQAYLIFSIILILCNLINKFKIKDLNFFQITFIIFSSNLLIWVKNEGIFYYIFFLIFIFFHSSLNKKIYIIFLGSSLLLIKFFMMSQISDVNSFDISQLEINFDYEFYLKIKLILTHIVVASFKYPIWLIFFLTLFVKRIEKDSFYIFYFLFFSFLLIFLIFLIPGAGNSKWTEWYVAGALDRIMFHLSAFLIIFISSRVKYLIKSFA
tara:strand:- start:245 stop:1513 length:1269 start_codon:yes stop_codon:yes gene_type:complete